MAVDRDLAERIVKLLNELTELDPHAMGRLVETRLECNKDLAHHHTVQVRFQDGSYKVGLLGILNGLVGVVEEGPKKGWGILYCNLEGLGTGEVKAINFWVGPDNG